MKKEKIIEAFACLGQQIENEILTPRFQQAIKQACKENAWFSEDNVMYALSAIGLWLNKQTLNNFSNRYRWSDKAKRVVVITAGNIPAVGFSDMMCVLLSGHNFCGKLSHQDKVLLPFLADLLVENSPEIANKISFSYGKISNFDAIIATGSNNSSQYFEYYFSGYPHILRKSRSSVAVLSQNVSNKQLNLLADDVLLYMGLGCRNVAKIYLPIGFDLNRLTNGFDKYSCLLDHSKYRNNYDYRKAIFLMNNVAFTDCGVVLLQESQSIYSPIAVLNYEFYDKIDDVFMQLQHDKDKLQCVVSDLQRLDTIPLGNAQQPSIDDFADGVDTMEFLVSLLP
ncbi:MAG: hypothetical protein LBO06_03555 [Bacteroidales bacterium]|jgi:hypothetical protein|nr:hypothetical protein [Bacteroidales bacterium]